VFGTTRKAEKPSECCQVRPVIMGKFGPPTLTCVRSWGQRGFEVGMICIQEKNELRLYSRYLRFFTILPAEKLYTEDGIRKINAFLLEFEATGLVCISEKIACWINDHRQGFPTGVAIWLPTNNCIRRLVSKKEQIHVAQRVGFNVLPTYLIDKDLRSVQGIPLHSFPLCLRPSEPTKIKPSFKVLYFSCQRKLIEWVKRIDLIERPIVAQPFISGPNMVVHGARTLSGDTIGLQAFLAERKLEGLTLTIKPTNLSKDLSTKCIEFTNQFKVTGNYHFDFLIDEVTRTVYFLELNSRFGGTTAKVYACGYDEPSLALQAYGIVNGKRQNMRNVTASSRQALLKYLYFTLRGNLTPLDYPTEPGPVRFTKTLYGLLTYRDDVFNFRDLKGSLALYLGNFKTRFA